MHTTVIDEVAINHNGDYSGDVRFTVPGHWVEKEVFGDNLVVSIPFEILCELVGQALQSEALGQLEQVSGHDFLRKGIIPLRKPCGPA